MLLISLIIAVLVKQMWGDRNPLHKDAWLDSLSLALEQQLARLMPVTNTLVFLTILILSTITVQLIALATHAGLLYIAFGVLLLLYCFGRGPFNESITVFIVAEARGDYDEASAAAQQLGADLPTENNWTTLNLAFIRAVSYRGFERFFAVVFWFVLIGPIGAWIYRFTHLWQQKHNNPSIEQWLFWLEWPAARVLALSYAITGNFSACLNEGKARLLSMNDNAKDTLLPAILGALSVDENMPQTREVTRRELEAIARLLSRTLWFWLGVIAIATVL